MAVSEFGAVDQHAHLAGLGGDDHKQYALVAQNTLANRPAPGRAGRLFRDIDTGRLYYDTGAAWGEMLAPGGGVLTGRLSLGVGGELYPHFAATNATLPQSYPMGITHTTAPDGGGWPYPSNFGIVRTIRYGTDVVQFLQYLTGDGRCYHRFANSGGDTWSTWARLADDRTAILPPSTRFREADGVSEGGQFVMEGGGTYPDLIIDRYNDRLRGIVGTERWSIHDGGSFAGARMFQHERFTSTTFQTTSTAYVTDGGLTSDLEFVAPHSGRVFFFWRVQMSNSGASHCVAAVRLYRVSDGVTEFGPSDDHALVMYNTASESAGYGLPINTTPGVTYRARVEYRVTGGTGSFFRRQLSIIPSL